jgi:heme/copper-type cytochrome/quinol oxidase subunit 2
MNRIPLANRALGLPLAGVVTTWWLFMIAQLVELNTPQPTYNNQGVQISSGAFHLSGYLFLLGIAATAVASLIGQTWAIRAREANAENVLLARSAHRFANLMVILSLVAGVIFVIGTFMGAFNSYSARDEDLIVRLVDVYIPIILGTALVVWLLLRAFVSREHEKNADGSKAKMSARQKALTLGYVVPILATAFAIILGLAVYDITKTALQVWVWVIIVLIVALGVIAGTRFAAQAKFAKQEKPKPKTALAAGAGTLNFVLSIVFGGVVGIMAFSFGSSAVSKLQTWSQPPMDCKDTACNSISTIHSPTWQWLFEDVVPAKLLIILAVVVIYFTVIERNKESK